MDFWTMFWASVAGTLVSRFVYDVLFKPDDKDPPSGYAVEA